MDFRRKTNNVLLFGIIFVSGCQEFLPSRDDPENYFTYETSVTYDVFQPPNFLLGRNQLVVLLKIVNAFDETIEETANLTGTVTVTWLPEVEKGTYPFTMQRTFQLSNSNILSAKGLDRNSNALQFNPGDTIIIGCFYNFITDDNTDLFGYFPTKNDNQCEVLYGIIPGFRKITGLQKFKVTAVAKLSDRTSSFYFPSASVEKCFVKSYTAENNPPDRPCYKLEGVSDYCKLVK